MKVALACIVLAACGSGRSTPPPVSSAAPTATEHPAFVDMPATVRPGMSIEAFVRVYRGLDANAIEADYTGTRYWARDDTLQGIEGAWHFEFRNGRLAGYVFEPHAAIERRTQPDAILGGKGCSDGFGQAQLDACVRAARAAIDELSRCYGAPDVRVGVVRVEHADDDRYRISAPSCALAINVLTATWSTNSARFRQIVWMTESKGESEYEWAVVVIGPSERFEDPASVQPTC